ncbi:MAG: STAS/SEC14 domain-containing protein [Rhodomicrobium sp.]
MIQIETLSPDTLKITPPTKLKADNFAAIAPQIDELIREQGQIRLLIDATALHGWENSEALEKHILFVKDHQSKVRRIAVIAGHDWQRWIAAIVNIFVHPQIKAFGIDQEAAARQWLME